MHCQFQFLCVYIFTLVTATVHRKLTSYNTGTFLLPGYGVWCMQCFKYVFPPVFLTDYVQLFLVILKFVLYKLKQSLAKLFKQKLTVVV